MWQVSISVFNSAFNSTMPKFKGTLWKTACLHVQIEKERDLTVIYNSCPQLTLLLAHLALMRLALLIPECRWALGTWRTLTHFMLHAAPQTLFPSRTGSTTTKHNIKLCKACIHEWLIVCVDKLNKLFTIREALIVIINIPEVEYIFVMYVGLK